MDHMRIAGTKPSSVIFSQNKVSQKLKSNAPKVPNQALNKSKGMV